MVGGSSMVERISILLADAPPQGLLTCGSGDEVATGTRVGPWHGRSRTLMGRRIREHKISAFGCNQQSMKRNFALPYNRDANIRDGRKTPERSQSDGGVTDSGAVASSGLTLRAKGRVNAAPSPQSSQRSRVQARQNLRPTCSSKAKKTSLPGNVGPTRGTSRW